MASKRKIILEDGQQYSGLAFGDETDKVCELVFNTSMVGYQEILSDPSYTDQAVVMTYIKVTGGRTCLMQREQKANASAGFVIFLKKAAQDVMQ